MPARARVRPATVAPSGFSTDRKDSEKRADPRETSATIRRRMRRTFPILAVVALLLAAPAGASASTTATAAVAAEAAPASITRVAVVRVNGVRVVRVTLRVTSHTDGIARLRRDGRTLAFSARVHLMPGTRTLSVRVPRTVRRGSATVRVMLIRSGRTWTLSRSVSLPRP